MLGLDGIGHVYHSGGRCDCVAQMKTLECCTGIIDSTFKNRSYDLKKDIDMTSILHIRHRHKAP